MSALTAATKLYPPTFFPDYKAAILLSTDPSALEASEALRSLAQSPLKEFERKSKPFTKADGEAEAEAFKSQPTAFKRYEVGLAMKKIDRSFSGSSVDF